jgi:hypothetical protein
VVDSPTKSQSKTFFFAMLGSLSRIVRHRQNKDTQLQAGWRERFDKPTWNIISNQKYENYALEVDGNRYQDCGFKNVTFIFHGTAPFEFRGNTQLHEGSLVFHSDDPAIDNFEKMKAQFLRLPGAQIETNLKDASGNQVTPPKLVIAPTIVKVADWIEDNTSNPQRTLAYPLKIRIQFRNDSLRSVGVRMSKYTANRAPAKEPQPFAVLQVKLGGNWSPLPNEFITVAPTQHFRAWIGLDHKKVTKQQVEDNSGYLGTLALVVDGETIKFDL